MVDSKRQIETIDAPLVSVLVITYNSAVYVLETLESIKVQTYQNIELIITDDGSRDDTVEICRQWLDENNSRFVRTELITSSVNTGIPANCNRAYKAAQGEWVKGIAGDDALLPDCIGNYIHFVKNNAQAEICHSAVRKYMDTLDEEHYFRSVRPREKMITALTAKRQHHLLKVRCCILAPTVFVKLRLIRDMEYFDESFPMCEDYPMWLKLTNAGYRFYYFDRETVKYRINSNSVTQQKKKFITQGEDQVNRGIYQKYFQRDSVLKWRLRYRIFMYQFLEKYGWNDRNTMSALIFQLMDLPVLNAYAEYWYMTGWKRMWEDCRDILKGKFSIHRK